MVLLHTPPGEMGAPAADFNLAGVDGHNHSLASYVAAPVLVVMFICNHCPYVKAVEKRLVVLANDPVLKEVAFVGISSNDSTNYPEDSFENMVKRSKALNYPFDYLLDATQEVGRAYGAVCTPDFFVFDANRKLRYRGRLDDSPRSPEAVTRQEMREAILALLNHQPVPEPQNPSLGCSIKWRE